MESKVLIAIDLSENSLRAVDYVGSVMSCHPKVEITMLHVIKEPSPDIEPDERQRLAYVEKARTEMLSLMEKAADRLTSRGVREKSIRLLVQVCKKPVSVAELILHEQARGGYGTVVIGRRGMSRKEEFLFGSISNKVVREAKDCAIWVIE